MSEKQDNSEEKQCIIPSDNMDSVILDSPVVHGNMFTFQQALSAEYLPQPDITAYELSRILPYLLGQALMQADYDQLGSAQRHLKILK